MNRQHRFLRSSVALLALAVLLAACSSGGGASPTPEATAQGPRPASTAKLVMVSPTPNEVVTGGTVHVVMTLTGATITDVTTTNIKPNEGHIHLYGDNNLVSMNYPLTQDLPLKPGSYVMRAEFVAAD